jgi:hypothetical protein
MNHQNHQTPRQREIFGRRFGSLLLLLELATEAGGSVNSEKVGVQREEESIQLAGEEREAANATFC